MLHSDVTNDKRLLLTEAVLEAKINKGLTWDEIAEGTGISTAFVTAALLGQHPLPETAAVKIVAQLGLGATASKILQTVPMRGSLPTTPPSDPTIYRFYEIVQIYGTTLKALIHELFGDGIMSAINFRMDVGKAVDPEGGERVIVTLDGKYLPTRPF